MNERIKELGREAGLLMYNPDGLPTKLEKFAQLLIQECIEQSLKVSHRDDDIGSIIASRIREHFGVEE